MEMEEEPLGKKERKALKRQSREGERERGLRRSTAKRIVLWGLTAFVLTASVAALWYLARGAGDETPFAEPAGFIVELTLEDHVKGPASASVVLLEYGDFQCPACGVYYFVARRLQEEFPNELKIAYRHFPLFQIHAKAKDASYAAEAAALQGKFWEMCDLLYERQEEWIRGDEEELFLAYAAELGLDTERFRADRKSDAVAEKVRIDLESAMGARLEGTPSFFLQGKRIANPRSYDAFHKLISHALSEFSL